jgi:3,4-dihydroxy 2-butanone 4-phosphate synthase / GTP cyclohydrolase II
VAADRTLTARDDERLRNELHAALSSIPEIIGDIRNGKMVILVDDEDRENEGDLVIAAQMATPDAVNFMAKHGRGLICLSLSPERTNQLGLPLMAQSNRSRTQTAFTVSIEASDGVTTGISASDRARTIAKAIDPNVGKEGIVSPGHVFPLVAREGGVLVRAGHTEAAVDIARLAGLNPAGVICEIMNDDGTMARLPDLVKFAQFHGLKIATIADLIAYRLRNERFVERILETKLTREHGGDFKLICYRSKLAGTEHLALIKGDISGPDPLLVRMHAINILDDVLHDLKSGRAHELESAIQVVGKAGRGVIVIIREQRWTSLSNQIRDRQGIPDLGAGAPSHEIAPALRDYGVGAQILVDLGVHEMILLSNVVRTVVGIEGYGLHIVGHRPIPPLGV